MHKVVLITLNLLMLMPIAILCPKLCWHSRGTSLIVGTIIEQLSQLRKSS